MCGGVGGVEYVANSTHSVNPTNRQAAHQRSSALRCHRLAQHAGGRVFCVVEAYRALHDILAPLRVAL
eukprot:3012995-Alexandrium_andersonii.AAC.1